MALSCMKQAPPVLISLQKYKALTQPRNPHSHSLLREPGQLMSSAKPSSPTASGLKAWDAHHLVNSSGRLGIKKLH